MKVHQVTGLNDQHGLRVKMNLAFQSVINFLLNDDENDFPVVT